MKILTKEEEQAHYNATVKGGTIGGVIGLAVVCPVPIRKAQMPLLTFPREVQPLPPPMPAFARFETSHFK